MALGPNILFFVEGDLLPNLDVEWEGQDITGFDIKLHFRKPDGTKVTKDAIIDDANAGGAGTAKFHFEWAVGDLVEGDSDAEIEAFDAAAKNETFPLFIMRTRKEIA